MKIKKSKVACLFSLALLANNAMAGFEVHDIYNDRVHDSRTQEVISPAQEVTSSAQVSRQDESYGTVLPDDGGPAPTKQGDVLIRGKLAAAFAEAKFKNLEGEEDLFQGVAGVGLQWRKYFFDIEVLGSETFFLPKLGPFPANNNAYVFLNGDVRPVGVFFTFGYFFPTYYKIFPDSLRPFVHMGAGFSVSTANIRTTTTAGSAQQRKTINTTAFAWNVAAGLSYFVLDNLSIDLSYRVNRFGKVDFGPIQGIEQSGQTFLSRGVLLGFTLLHTV